MVTYNPLYASLQGSNLTEESAMYATSNFFNLGTKAPDKFVLETVVKPLNVQYTTSGWKNLNQGVTLPNMPRWTPGTIPDVGKPIRDVSNAVQDMTNAVTGAGHGASNLGNSLVLLGVAGIGIALIMGGKKRRRRR